ncbi:MAG: sulfite exporter TauE/SafE family protein [Actinomycetota bacterium]|nr:sulfite exporter TauE/SafE family protein [Actinomycetota bacterium]
MMDATPLNAVLTVMAGVVTGLLSAAFGVGGAVVSTPAVRLLGVSAAFAVGTTLPSILPSAATGTVRYTRESLVRWSAVAWAAPPGIAFAVLGSLLSKEVPGEGHWLMIATAALLGITSWRMAHPERPTDVAGTDQGDPPSDHPLVLIGVGALAGLLSGLLGVGGGVVLVPGLAELARVPLKSAIATSLVCVGILAVPSTVTHWSVGDIDWRTAILLSLGVVPGARLGAVAAIRASDARLRLAVASFLGVVSVVYGVSEALALARQ